MLGWPHIQKLLSKEKQIEGGDIKKILLAIANFGMF